MVTPDQHDEGLLVACAQATEQLRVRVLIHRRQPRPSFPVRNET